MQSRMKVEDPRKVIYTVTTTATAEEWEKFRDALDTIPGPPYEVHHFRAQITDLLSQARKIYWPRQPEDKQHDQG